MSKSNISAQMRSHIHGLLSAGYTEVLGDTGAVSVNEMQAAFSEVEPDKGWKYPIDAIIPFEAATATFAAIAFYCGSHCYIRIRQGGDGFNLFAPGYYECIGA